MVTTVAISRDAAQVAVLLNSPEIGRLIFDLDATRWTGRPGYPIRTMVGAALVKSVYALPTWTRTVRLISEHAALREAIGGAPSVHACYRFTVKLREHGNVLAGCLNRVLAALRDARPEIGQTVAIDGSDMPAYANGQRYLSKGGKLRERYSGPDASWGHRSSISTRSGGGYYGYKVHTAVCTVTGLPLAWQVETAKDAEAPVRDPRNGRAVRPGRGRQGDVRPTGGAPEQGWVSSACGSATVGPAMEVAAPWS